MIYSPDYVHTYSAEPFLLHSIEYLTRKYLYLIDRNNIISGKFDATRIKEETCLLSHCECLCICNKCKNTTVWKISNIKYIL